MPRKLFVILWLISTLVFSSSVWGENVSTLFEEGIYAEETKGDLDEAITIYQKILDKNEGNRTSIAKVYYRLGTCYLKTGDDAKAVAMFKELLTRFPDQKQIASEAKSQLVKLNAFDEENQINMPLEIGPVPWESGEICYYNIKTATGMEIGKLISSVKETTENGKDLWRIDHYAAVPVENTRVFTRTDALKESFIPVSGIMRGSTAGMGINNKVIYEKDHVSLDIDFVNNKDKKEIPINNVVYDNDLIGHLIRMLPIKDNYSTSFSMLLPQSGTIVNVNLRIIGRETLTVPVGTFDCFCVELKLEFGTKQKFWYSADDKRYLVKMEAQTIMELEKVAQISIADTVEFHDKEFGVSMSAPKGWHFIKSPIAAQFNMVLQVLPPELKPNASVLFLINEHGGLITKDSLRSIMEQEANVVKQVFKNYSVNPESWTASVIGGLDALSFSADYDEKDNKMIEYRTYIIDSSRVYAFIIKSAKETFEDNKAEFDSVIQSFQKG